MDIKLHELLATINFPKEWYPSLESCSLSRVKVNSKTMKIILDSDKQIPVDTYIKLNDYLNDFFHTNCTLEINVEKKSFDFMSLFSFESEKDEPCDEKSLCFWDCCYENCYSCKICGCCTKNNDLNIKEI